MTLSLRMPANSYHMAEERARGLERETFGMVAQAKANPVGAFLQRTRLNTVYRQIDLLTDAIDAHPIARDAQLAELADAARAAA